MASESVTIPAAAIPELRRMLIIGQTALSEVERMHDGAARSELPKHPTGAPEMGAFASALHWLECVSSVED